MTTEDRAEMVKLLQDATKALEMATPEGDALCRTYISRFLALAARHTDVGTVLSASAAAGSVLKRFFKKE
jgi:hypothetical protein